MVDRRRSLITRPRELLAAWLVITAFVCVTGAVSGEYYLGIAIAGLSGAVLALTWDMVAYSGQLSLAHTAFFGLGEYTTAILGKHGVDPRFGLALGGLVAAVAAVLIALACLRMSGVYFAIATFAFASTLIVIADALPGLTGGTLGIFLVNRFDIGILNGRIAIFAALAVILQAAFAAYAFLHLSRWSLALRTMRENEGNAELAGVNVRALRVVVFAISAFFVGTAGAVQPFFSSFIDPTSAFSLNQSILPIVFSVFGGLYTIIGPVIGAVVLTRFTEYVRSALGNANALVYGIALMFIVLALPDGVMGALERITYWLDLHRRRVRFG